MNALINFIVKIYNSLKKIFLALFEFVKHLINWFKARFYRIKEKHPNIKAISLIIKNNLASDNYNQLDLFNDDKERIVHTFYDEDTGEIIVEETEVALADKLDDETKANFTGKDMLVLN